MKKDKIQIAIVGIGPAGVGAAVRLHRAGFRELFLLDRFDRVGGIPSLYIRDGVSTYALWSKGKIISGEEYAGILAGKLKKRGIETYLESTVLNLSLEEKSLQVVSPQLGHLQLKAKAILLACGAREQNATERSWIFGQRPARVLNSINLLEFIRRSKLPASARIHIVGSETISYGMASKLDALRSKNHLTMIDNQAQYGCSIFSRIYFKRWATPRRIAPVGELNLKGRMSLEKLELVDGQSGEAPSDYLLMTGKLVPNTELIVQAGLAADKRSRRISRLDLLKLNRKGIFLAGNIAGAARGGEWAYFSGYRTAAHIISYLKTA